MKWINTLIKIKKFNANCKLQSDNKEKYKTLKGHKRVQNSIRIKLYCFLFIS